MAKPTRPLEEINAEVCEVAGKIGFLQYQMEREIPRDIEKYFNQLQDLQGEAKKAMAEREAFLNTMKKNGAAEVKSEMNGATHPSPPEDQETKPELAVVQ